MGVLVGSPSLRLTESEKRAIFRVQLERALEDMRLDEEDKVTRGSIFRGIIVYLFLPIIFLADGVPRRH